MTTLVKDLSSQQAIELMDRISNQLQQLQYLQQFKILQKELAFDTVFATFLANFFATTDIKFGMDFYTIAAQTLAERFGFKHSFANIVNNESLQEGKDEI